MAKNPMQRKAQNSFLLGMLVTLLITGMIIAFLVIQLTQLTKDQKKLQGNMRSVYIVSQDIASGENVTVEKINLKSVDITTVPSNVLTAEALEGITNVVDENGNLIKIIDVVAKINLKQGTVLTSDMVAEAGELAADLRTQEYNMIMLPSQINTDKYVDIRLRLPNGKDYIVVSHKKVTVPEIDGAPSLNTISVNMDETETLTLSCAIVESYKIKGSILYASQYIEPGLQAAATPTYIPDDETLNLISRDPNCVAEAKQALFKRNNDAANKGAVRNPINNGIRDNSEQEIENSVAGLEAELQKAQEERQKYLESLGGVY